MSYSLCTRCGSQLVGYPGSSCTNTQCANHVSRAQRRNTVHDNPPAVPDDRQQAARLAKRKAAKAARKKNR